MKFLTSHADINKIDTDALVILTDKVLSSSSKYIDDNLQNCISKMLCEGDFTGKNGSSCVIRNVRPNIRRVILVGKEKNCSFQKSIKAIENAAMLLIKKYINSAVWVIDENYGSGEIEIISRSIVQANYSYKTITKTNLESVCLWSNDKESMESRSRDFKYGAAVGKGMNTCRHLGNMPANLCTPRFLSEQAISIAKNHDNVEVEIMDEAQLEKLKMMSLLSVGNASEQKSNLITLKYKGASDDLKPIILVGKAVTFDTGGISLKPGRGMDEMKFDMCGGASVLGVISALIETKLPVNVIGLVPAVENMPAGNATKPGDVIESMSGLTIEILNTDAEGRLILCDALTYANQFEPTYVIDIATLTGAVIGALGKLTTGMLSNNDELAQLLLQSGTSSGDRAWQLPIWEEYDEQLESNFADVANIGGEAGTITAACFLSRFTKQYKWAHLDIAGTAWVSGKKKGATGRPVPLLMEFLKTQAC